MRTATTLERLVNILGNAGYNRATAPHIVRLVLSALRNPPSDVAFSRDFIHHINAILNEEV